MFGFSALANLFKPSPPSLPASPRISTPPHPKPGPSRDTFEASKRAHSPFSTALARPTAPAPKRQEEGKSARGAQGAAIHTGRVLNHDGRERISYDTQARSLPRTGAGSEARDALKLRTRASMTPFGKNLSDWLDRPNSPRRMARATKTGAELAKSANRPSPLWTRAGQVSKATGGGLLVVGAGVSVYNIATAPEGQRARTVAREAGAWTGALGLGAGGAKLGALVGTPGGPLGMAIGAGVGGLAGGIVGAIGGTRVGDRIYGWWTGGR